MRVRSISSYAYMLITLRRNRKVDGDAFRPDLFTQIAGLDFAAILDLDRRDIGADRADIVVDRFGEQRAGFVGGPHDRSVRQIGRPALCSRSINHDAIPGPIGGHDGWTGDLGLLLQWRCHSAATCKHETNCARSDLRHGADCATTSPIMRMAGPP